MCSFDIKSLFTNIPLEETIDVCLDCFYCDDKIGKPTVLENLLRKLLIKATTEVEFSYDGVMYRQKDGVVMGSPLGPVLANLFVGCCENLIDEDKWPSFYTRFVDDTFSILPSQRNAMEFFDVLNGLHQSL